MSDGRSNYWEAYRFIKESFTPDEATRKRINERIQEMGGVDAVLAQRTCELTEHLEGNRETEAPMPDYEEIESAIDEMLAQPQLNGILRDVLRRARRICGWCAILRGARDF